MNIGVTLPVEFLMGHPHDQWGSMYGEPTKCLLALKSLGVTSVELRGVSEKIYPKDLHKALKAVLAADLTPTIHGWLPRNFTVLETLFETADEVLQAAGVDQTIPITVHGYVFGESILRQTAADDTVSGLKTLGFLLSSFQTKFIPAFEICRDKGEEPGSIGNSFDAVYGIAETAGFNDLGLCWDMGHTLSNHLFRGHALMPSVDFLRHVVHTHIHIVGDNDRTHAYFTHESKYIADCINLLKNANYAGIYNLELYPERWGESPALSRTNLEETVEALRGFLA